MNIMGEKHDNEIFVGFFNFNIFIWLNRKILISLARLIWYEIVEIESSLFVKQITEANNILIPPIF